MKNSATIFAVLFLFSISLFGQRSHNAWKLGLNLGSTYQCSDITPYPGVGYGVTFEKANCQNEKNFFDLTWRFRYLHGNTLGQDYRRSYGILNNAALNGQANNGINYVSNGGYAFQNYKMKLDEESFELALGLNRLREKTGILLYGWGGIGLTTFKTYIDQLDASGTMYDYSGIDNAAPKTSVRTQLNALYDGNYETAAEGSNKLNWRLTPSAGAGFGYEFGRNFSLAFEYKTSWPHTDLLDGNQWNVANVKSGDNDHYHYAGLHLLFRIGGGGAKPPTNTTYTTPVTPLNPNPVVSNNMPLPVIVFTSPQSNPFQTANNSVNVIASIQNINSAQNLSLKINGNSTGNFTYDPYSRTMSFFTGLIDGNNMFEVKAVNQSGSDVKTMIVNYIRTGSGGRSADKPIVKIISPSVNPFSTSVNSVNVTATVLNVSSRNEIMVISNGISVNSFNYDFNSKLLSVISDLNPGTNNITIIGSNAAGSDSKTATIVYSANTSIGSNPKPEVIIITPARNPDNSPNCFLNLVASVKNVNSKNDISLKIDGAAVSNFDYNTASQHLTYQGNLNNGTFHKVVIVATTSFGTASAELTEICGNSGSGTPTPVKPEVMIISPAHNPDNSPTCFLNLVASVKNVTSKNDISLKIDGSEVVNFDYNTASQHLTYQGNLNNGNTHTVLITATTLAGTASANLTVVCGNKGHGTGNSDAPIPAKPEVMIISPAHNPDNLPTCFLNLVASVKNVASKNNINLKIDGSEVINFDYNTASQHLTYQGNLKNGNTHTVLITATTFAGTASANLTVNCGNNGHGTGNSDAPIPAKPEVMIISPAHNPDNSPTCFLNLVASVKNVASKNNISLKIDGSEVINFDYNTASQHLTYQGNLNKGNTHTVLITATTFAGTASASLTVVCDNKGPGTGNSGGSLPSKPEVMIISPAHNPDNSPTCFLNLVANVKNVTSKNDISFTIDGSAVTAFDYNTASQHLNYQGNLNNGNTHTIVITATTLGGTASANLTVICSNKGPGTGNSGGSSQPEIMIISPAHNPDNSPTCFLNLVANVKNVNSKNDIVLKIDGNAILNFDYNLSSHHLTYQGSLVKSTTHNIEIVASTIGGTATAQLTEICGNNGSTNSGNTGNSGNGNTGNGSSGNNSGNSGSNNSGNGNIAAKPLVTIITPADNYSTVDSVIILAAKIENVKVKNGITVKVNGISNNNFSFEPSRGNLTVNLNLTQGDNKIEVEASNQSGADSKSISVKCTKASRKGPAGGRGGR